MDSITLTARLLLCERHSQKFSAIDTDATEGSFVRDPEWCSVDGCMKKAYTVWLMTVEGECAHAQQTTNALRGESDSRVRQRDSRQS